MNNWYIADTHFGHDNIIKHCNRPFRSANHMDSALIDNICAKVGPSDRLWVIGDLAFGPKAKDAGWLHRIFARLPGEKHLVVGNHDGDQTRSLPWASVSDVVEVEDGDGPKTVLSHYPMLTWHRARKGALHLFGHVHNQWLGSRNAVNVGVDVWSFAPISLRDAKQRARTLPPNKHWDDVERVSF